MEHRPSLNQSQHSKTWRTSLGAQTYQEPQQNNGIDMEIRREGLKRERNCAPKTHLLVHIITLKTQASSCDSHVFTQGE